MLWVRWWWSHSGCHSPQRDFASPPTRIAFRVQKKRHSHLRCRSSVNSASCRPSHTMSNSALADRQGYQKWWLCAVLSKFASICHQSQDGEDGVCVHRVQKNLWSLVLRFTLSTIVAFFSSHWLSARAVKELATTQPDHSHISHRDGWSSLAPPRRLYHNGARRNQVVCWNNQMPNSNEWTPTSSQEDFKWLTVLPGESANFHAVTRSDTQTAHHGTS